MSAAALIFLVLFLVACQPAAGVNPTATAESTPSAIAVATPAVTAVLATEVAPTASVPVATSPSPRATSTRLAPSTALPSGTPTAEPSPTAAATATAVATETPLPTATAEPLFVESGFGITLPSNVSISLFAEGLNYPTALAFDEQANLYVGINNAVYPTRPVGEILRLRDTDGDGAADETTPFATALDRPVGLLVHNGELFVAQRGSIEAMTDSDGDGVADDIRTVVGQLPAQGLHQNNSMVMDRDGLLYFTMGSSTNNGPETNPLNGTILRVAPSGGTPEIFASGFRNPFDLGFDSNGELFATDNGCDPPVCVDAPEEFNHVVAGGRYGFPDFVGTPPEGSGTIGPIATFTSHASANGMVIYQGEMFPEWRGDAFVALFGSYLEGFGDVGHRVLRVDLSGSGDGVAAAVQPFGIGFARPLDIAVAPDGALFVADFEAGRIYRLSR